MNTSTKARLDEMAFGKYGVIFSYLEASEKRALLEDLRERDRMLEEFKQKRLTVKPRLISFLLEKLSPASALNHIINETNVRFTWCPYESEDEFNKDMLESLVMAFDFSQAERILEDAEERF
jgi:hypothetical protein